MKIIKAFKLYGKFDWPPFFENKSNQKKQKVSGVVEVAYALFNDNNSQAFLTWKKASNKQGDYISNESLNLPEGKNVFHTDFDVRECFGSTEAPKDSACVWVCNLDSSKTNSYTPVLRFRGGLIFEQYDPNQQPGSPPSLRWPQISIHNYAAGKDLHCELIIGQARSVTKYSKSAHFSFSINLPVPVPQTSYKGTAKQKPKLSHKPVFSFECVFKADEISQGSIGEIDNLYSTFYSGQYTEAGFFWTKEFKNELKNVAKKRLGIIGFAAGTTNKSSQHLNYSNFLKDNNQLEKLSTCWPVGDGSPAASILKELGFRTLGISKCIDVGSTESQAYTEKSCSLNFDGKDKNRFIYRIAIRAKAPLQNGESDIHILEENGFRIFFKNELDGWLDLDSELMYLDLDCTWNISDDDIHTVLTSADECNATKINLNVSPRIYWKQRIRANLEAGKTKKNGVAVYRQGLLGEAFLSMRAAQEGLQEVAAVQPQSFFPVLADDTEVWFALHASSAFIQRRHLYCDQQSINTPARQRPKFILTLASKDQVATLDENRSTGFPISLMFCGIDTELPADSRALQLHNRNENSDLPKGVFAQYRIEPAKNKKPLSGRLGALAFETTDKLISSGESLLSIGSRPPLYIQNLAPNKTMRVSVALELALSLKSAKPTTVDIPHGDRTQRPPPLLIGSAVDEQAPFLLKIRETVSGDEDHHLTAQLLNSERNSSAHQTYTVLSDQPFGLFRFSRRTLSSTGDEQSALVASFDSDQRTWHFRQVAEEYHYVFPPQAVGESTDKPRRLEIHDAKVVGEKQNATDLFRPYPDSAGGNDGVPLKTHLVEFRLAPSTEVWIRPSDLQRGYYLPEWSAHDIFRQRGDFGLGARLTGLRGEFLYGLSVGIDTRNEAGASRQSRVAEIEALTGKLPAEKYTLAPYRALLDRWRRVRNAMLRRHERLECWVTDPNGLRPFVPARFSNGVQFALRETALHRPPVPPPPFNELTTSKTKSSNLPMVLHSSRPGPRYHDQGLAGGALWPLESWSVFQQMMRNPESIGGTIERVALSPTGGDADQKALFLNGLVSVISETRAGFVQRQQVEILGRIGALWHRAKHVVVYARTVNPSAQFAPEWEDDRCRTRTRRPVLRKISEYIEILQPSRGYPDTPNTSEKACGFLDSVRFNTHIISVDSAWGSDIGTVGYKIPLWNYHSARKRPQVYPKPDIAFVTVAEGEGERPLTAQECLDPDNLYFFADAVSSDPDTDRWSPRQGIDYCTTLPTTEVADIADQSADDRVKSQKQRPPRKASAPRVLPGYRRFTWRLAPGGAKSQINHTRGSQPIYAGLESITFMRRAPTDNVPLRDGQEQLLRLLNPKKEDPEVFRKLDDELVKWPYWIEENMGDGPSEVKRVVEARRDFLERVISKSNDAGEYFQRLVNELEKVELPDNLKKALDNVANNFGETSIGDLADSVDRTANQCQQLVTKSVDGLRRKRLLIRENLHAGQARLAKQMDNSDWWKGFESASNLNEAKETLKSEILQQVDVSLKPLFQESFTAVSRINADIEQVRAIVQDAQGDVTASLERARRRVDALALAYQDHKPWSPNRLARFQDKLYTDLSGIAADALAAVGEAQQRINTETDLASNAITLHVNRALGHITRQQIRLLDSIEQQKIAIKSLAAGIRLPLEKLIGRADSRSSQSLFERLDRQLTKIKKTPTGETHKVKIEELRNAIETLRSRLSKVENRINSLESTSIIKLDEIQNAAQSVRKELEKQRINEKFNSLNSTLKGLIDEEIEEELKPGLKLLNSESEALQTKLTGWALPPLNHFGGLIDPIISGSRLTIRATIEDIEQIVPKVFEVIDNVQEEFRKTLGTINNVLGKDKLLGLLKDQALTPAVDQLINQLEPGIRAWGKSSGEEKSEKLRAIQTHCRTLILDLADRVADPVHGLLGRIDGSALEQELGDICDGLTTVREKVVKELREVEETFSNEVNALKEGPIKDIEENLADLNENYENIIKLVDDFDNQLRDTVNRVGATAESAKAYGDHLLESASNLGEGGVAAAPNNLLRLYSAATASPELAALESNIDRIRCSYDELQDLIKTTKANALFSRLGDELKALGIEIPFDGFGDQLKIDAEKLKSDFDISRLFPNFGGLNLNNLFEGVKLSDDNPVRIRHDFDKQQASAWVQIDAGTRLQGRHEFFAFGPVAAYFLHPTMAGQVRLEASADTDEVQDTQFASIRSDLELVAAGQKLVTLKDAEIRFSGSGGPEFLLDPSNIRPNEVFQFLMDALGQMFPDDIAGLKIIKERGIPIGVEHVLTMPNLSLMAGTSGVSNIQLINKFRLLAFPDFIVANRFNLSTPELPFIFSFFVVGGTGYIQVDTEYRPHDKRLLVVVEAAAGGSAALGFAFGPVSGSVFIAMSVALNYRKLIGSSGGGLSVSLVLVIAGNVSLWGCAHMYLGMVLRVTYRDAGQIDGEGTLAVSLRISSFLKLSYRTSVVYKLRDGRSTTTVRERIDITPEDKLKKIKEKADKLQGARR